MSLKRHSRQFVLAGMFLFTVLMGVYALSYSGLPAADDEQLLAAAALNVADGGRLTAEQLLGNTRLNGIYGGIEPLHSLVASWVLRSGIFDGTGRMQGLFWLNSWYTALTAVVLFGLVLRLGYDRRHAILAGLVLGLATPAWPYAKTFFREPLAMLLLVLACFFLLLATEWQRGLRSRIISGLLFLILVGGAVLTKVLLAAVLPAFGLLFWLRTRRCGDRPGRVWFQIGVTLAAFLLLAGAGTMLWMGAFPPRLTLAFVIERYRNLSILPHGGFWKALAGIFISPGKGLFSYTPVLAGCVVSGLFLRHGHRELVWFPLLAATGLAAAQALAYDDSWWNLTWSTRFLLPVLPFLTLMGLPGMRWLEEKTRRNWRWAAWGFAAVSSLIQLGGVLLADAAYLASLYPLSLRPVPELAVWNVRYAPWIGHWRLILQGAPLNLAAARVLAQGETWIWGLLAGQAIFLAGSVTGLMRGLRSTGLRQMRLWVGILGVGLICVLGFSGKAFASDPAYARQRGELAAAEVWVAALLEEGDGIIISPYLYPVWYHTINGAGFGQPWYSWPVPEDDEAAKAALERFREAASSYRRVWLIEERSTWGEPFPAGGQLQVPFELVETRTFLDAVGENALQVSLFEIP